MHINLLIDLVSFSSVKLMWRSINNFKLENQQNPDILGVISWIIWGLEFLDLRHCPQTTALGLCSAGSQIFLGCFSDNVSSSEFTFLNSIYLVDGGTYVEFATFKITRFCKNCIVHFLHIIIYVNKDRFYRNLSCMVWYYTFCNCRNFNCYYYRDVKTSFS